MCTATENVYCNRKLFSAKHKTILAGTIPLNMYFLFIIYLFLKGFLLKTNGKIFLSFFLALQKRQSIPVPIPIPIPIHIHIHIPNPIPIPIPYSLFPPNR